ncbi:MAG: uroporphyrinogen-III C-methyltransferase [Pyrinomonadaceae bacterium]
MPTHVMKEKVRSGVMVVGHGSRRPEANEDVRLVAHLISQRGGYELVEAAFLEIEAPNVSEGFTRLVKRGACSVTVHPYFLSPGRHTHGDLPREVSDASASFPGVSYQITEPLSAHRLVIEASIERIRETQRVEAAKQGIVYLVGAGPGAPSLLTIRGRDVLAECDVVIYDSLIDPEILKFAPARAEKIYAGKVGGGTHTPQADINRLMIQRVREGNGVVRLKGGDPFLFGRGGEEAEDLQRAAVPFEIVPGVTSALAVPAFAGIPVSQRDLASSVAIVTGARSKDGAIDLGKITNISRADTIVVLMGLAHLREIAEHLVACGRSEDTPVAVIRWGTYETQETVVGTLDSIAEKAAECRMRSPAVIIVGEVVRLRERLNWFENRFPRQSDVLDPYGDIVAQIR